MKNPNFKQIFLYLLISSVVISALVGIVVILLGNWGELETKILLTTTTITLTSILGLACGAYLEKRPRNLLPVCGIFLAVLSAVLWMILIWYGTVQPDSFEKTLASSTLLAAACSHLSLLSIANLERKFLWSHYAAHFSIWTLTIIVLFIIWIENDPNDTLIRIIGVLSIVIASLTIMTPVFHWLGKGELAKNDTTIKEIDAKINRLKDELRQLEKQRAELSTDEN